MIKTLFVAFVLVQSGDPQCEIQMDIDAHPATKTAAVELTNWVAQMTDVALPIVTKTKGRSISFALRDDPVFQETDGYRVIEKGDSFTIEAKYPKGHLNGVFRLLSRNTDIIWPRPGTVKDPVAIFSRSDSLQFDARTYAKPDIPAFRLRHDGYHASLEGMLWDMRNCLVTPGNWRWFMRKERDVERARQLGVWDSYYNSWGGAHNMVAWWFPYHEHQNHPEFYMLTPTGRDTRNGGLCVSNPDLPSAFANAMLKKMEDRKIFPESLREVAVLMEDTDQTCRCESCSKPFTCYDGTVLTPKDANFRATRFFDFFVKALEKVWEEKPDLVVRQYAYVYLSIPPKVRIPKNLKLEFCPYPRNMKQSVMEGSDNQKWRERTNGWLALTKNIFWREYYFCGCIYYPRPISDTVETDFRYLAREGIPAVYCDGCTAVDSRIFKKGVYTSVKQPTAEFWDVVGVEKWVVGQLMWDPFKSARSLREEYLKRVFREAAPSMIRFYDILRESWYSSSRPSGWQDAAFPSAAYYIVQQGHVEDVRAALKDAAHSAVHPVAKEWIGNVQSIVERWIKESPQYLSGPLQVPCGNSPVFFPHFKYLRHPGSKSSINGPYPVRVSVVSTGDAFHFSFYAPFVEKEKEPPRMEVQLALPQERGYQSFSAQVVKTVDGWRGELLIPFSAVKFRPIQMNTIRCCPFVVYHFGGLGKDLPLSWEGGVPCLVKGWGELIVDLE